MEKEILSLFKYSRGTYYSWKKEKRPIIKLIEKYFTEEDLKEFINTGRISKLETHNNYGISLSIAKEYLSYIKEIIDFTKKEIIDGVGVEDTLLFIYFDFINFISLYDKSELFYLNDDTQCREITLKELLNQYFNKNPEKYSSFALHYLGNFNLVTASYILEILINTFSDVYKLVVIYDYKSTYLHLIFEQFYKKEITEIELKNLFEQNKERPIKNYLKATVKAPVL